MNQDGYYASSPNPAPRTIADEVEAGLSKRKRRRVRSVESDVRRLWWLDEILNLCCWWVWW